MASPKPTIEPLGKGSDFGTQAVQCVLLCCCVKVLNDHAVGHTCLVPDNCFFYLSSVPANCFCNPVVSQVDPSGSYFAWKASAIGKNMTNAKTFLEKR